MNPPIFARLLADAGRQAVAAGLRAADAFTLRRSQIVQASAAGHKLPQIATALGRNQRTGRRPVHASGDRGVAALAKRPSRAHTVRAAFTPAAAERLRDRLHRSPREFGHPTSRWTLDLAAKEARAQGLAERVVSGETVRAALGRLGVRWRRAKRWIASPDSASARKNAPATACSA